MQKGQGDNLTTLHIAEIPYESGNIKFRYSRRMGQDGQRWLRHGLFVSYHESGTVASEGNYENGLETGVWRDYHDNGQLASEGSYVDGKEEGLWKYWSLDGSEEQPVTYKNGEEVV
jgi:antitoxin component YwqK of YwqJK toxin-antitoxin module